MPEVSAGDHVISAVSQPTALSSLPGASPPGGRARGSLQPSDFRRHTGRPAIEQRVPVTWHSAAHEVEALVAARRSMAEIEGFVDGLPLDREDKSALWLVAWSRQTMPLAGASPAKRARRHGLLG